MNIFSCATSILKMLEGPSSLTYSSFKNLRSHLKVELLLLGDSKLPVIDNNLILKASFKYIMTTNRFSVPLFWYCFLSLALNIYIYIYIHLSSSGSLPLPTLFSLFYLREQWDMCLCCIFLSLFWLSLCKIFFIYFLSCPIIINYIIKKSKAPIFLLAALLLFTIFVKTAKTSWNFLV